MASTTQETQIEQLIEELRGKLNAAKARDLTREQAFLCQEAWKWARKEYVPNTPGNLRSVRFYLCQVHAISMPSNRLTF